MILRNTAELKKFISVASNFEFSEFELYIDKAIDGYTRKYVGDLHELLEDETPENENSASIKNKARKHLQSAIANFGYFLFMPYASVTMDASGLMNIVSDQRKNVEWWQKNDISRELLRSGHESMDLLLAILEENPAPFAQWTADFGSKNKELLIHSAAEFQNHYNISSSRQTYLAMVPAIRQVQDQYIATFLCEGLIETLKESGLSGNLLKVKDYTQKAIVAFTIAKVYDEGIFNLDASGIKLKFDTLPNETVKAVDYGKPVEQLSRAIKKHTDNGTNYLGMVREIITANPIEFNQCDSVLLEKPLAKYEIYNTLGVVGL